MKQLDHRFLSIVKNSIKKSIVGERLTVSPREGLKKSKVSLKLDIGEPAFDERAVSQLFTGFFNNKMTLPIFLIQSKGGLPSAKLVASTIAFLDDIYRHMMMGEQQLRYRLVFKWLKIFFRKLPNVSYRQRQRETVAKYHF